MLLAEGLSVTRICPVAGCGIPVARHRDENAPIQQSQAGATALTAEAIAEAVVAKQEEKDISKREMVVTISGATQTKTVAVLNRLDLARIIDDDPVPLASYSAHFSPFAWDGRDEDAGLKDAKNHIETQLGKFGVRIGRGGYKVEDVHTAKTLLNFHDPKVGDIRGGTDVVVVPYKTAKGGISTACCVLFELKTDENVLEHENRLRHFENQALLELLSARCLSRQPGILVVLTDLFSGAILYTIEYRIEYDSFEVVEKETTLDEMGILVAEFLASKAVPDAGFRPREEDNNLRDQCCITFKKRKLSHDVGLAWEQFEEMAEDTAPNSRERAELVAQLFRAMEVPQMPSFVHHCLYS